MSLFAQSWVPASAVSPVTYVPGARYKILPHSLEPDRACLAACMWLLLFSLLLAYQVRGDRTGSSHSGVDEYPRKKKQRLNQKWYTPKS